MINLPTITVPNACGLPHSSVSSELSSSSPTVKDNMLLPDELEGSMLAQAAFRRTSCHALTFASNPSGLIYCCRLKSEYRDGRRALQ